MQQRANLPVHYHMCLDMCSQQCFCIAGSAHAEHQPTACKLSEPQQASQGEPDISLLHPELQKQWDHAANAYLGNIVIRPQSHCKVWWRCDQCPDGHLHQWESQVKERTKGTGCPQCSGKKVCKHNSLATIAPWAAAQWDFEANADLGTPDSTLAQSNLKVGWHCHECGHKWTTTPNARVSKSSGCRKCQPRYKTKQPTFAESAHPLLAQWDHKSNAAHGNFPSEVTLGSHKKIYWLCSACPAGQVHSWVARPGQRIAIKHPTGCPFCAGQAACKCNSLQALYPDIAAQWDHSKTESQPSDYTAGSNHLAWWQSPQRGSWQQSIIERTSGADRSRAREQLG